MRIYNTDFDVQFKDDRSPLTAADRAAHRIIRSGLEALHPRLPLLSEESHAAEHASRHSWRTYWLVDPLDGTKEFIKKNGEFTVNIAMIHEHAPVMGVVYAPALGRLYTGIQDGGAWVEDSQSSPRRISVAATAADPLRVVGSRSHPSDELANYLRHLPEYRLVPMGSSLKICLIAAGEADIYPRLGPTSEWDTAAAHAILVSAGGSMIDRQGRELRYNTRETLLNPHFLAFGDHSRNWLISLEDQSGTEG